MGKTSSKHKHQGKKTTKSRGDRRARKRANRDMLESIKNGTEITNMSEKETHVRVHNAIEITVLVAENDYKYNLNDWHELTKSQQEECERDATQPSKDDEYAKLIYIQKWIIRQDVPQHKCLQASLNGLMDRSWIVIDKE